MGEVNVNGKVAIDESLFEKMKQLVILNTDARIHDNPTLPQVVVETEMLRKGVADLTGKHTEKCNDDQPSE